MEQEQGLSMPFLDVCICRENDQVRTSVYHKKTYTGLLTNYYSFTADGYKTGLIRTLIDRAFKICSNWNDFQRETDKISHVLQRNQFPRGLVDRFVSRYVESTRVTDNATARETPGIVKRFSLPYIGHFSFKTKKKLARLVSKYCIDLNIQLAFSSFKIARLFGTKDHSPLLTRSCVVYKFVCAGCAACYIGETRRHLLTRVNEHISQKSSNIHRHFEESPACRQSYSTECFQVIDSAMSDFQLKIKEALHIHWTKPSLNVQVKHYDLKTI